MIGLVGMIDFTELNPEQARAVGHKNGPVLIVAGAGAGKTKTLTSRILHLVTQGVPPEQILAITFTNKAAREMLDRVGKLLGKEPPRYAGLSRGFPWIGTFHGLGAMLMREFPQEAGVSPNFTILDEDDAVAIIRRAIKSLGFDPKFAEPRKIRGMISRAKGQGISREAYEKDVRGNSALLAARTWKLYEEELRKAHGVDFDDLLLLTVSLLKNRPDIREHLTRRWSHIHVDEYQDTSGLQYELVHALSGAAQNLCVVGDSDQNIYSWRGANIENILNFERDFPGAQVITLEENYRSTQTILDAANSIIEKNTLRKPKRLFTKNGDGEPITVIEALDEGDEARTIAAHAAQLIAQGIGASAIAVLYRANFQSRVIEEAFLSLFVPYTLIGTRFFERKEVKDMLSYIRLALHPESPVDLLRAIATPSRGIGEKSVAQIIAGKKEDLSGAMRDKIGKFFSIVDSIRRAIETLPAGIALREAAVLSGILPMLESDEEEDRIGNISELISLASRYDDLPPKEGIERFLSDTALASDQDHIDRRDGVRLMTIHAAKGLEFDTVFITGLEDGLFPSERAETMLDLNRQEEERRLFYVAITRAKRKLFLSHAAMRTIFGARQMSIPSSFLADIPEHLTAVDHENKSPWKEIKNIYVDE